VRRGVRDPNGEPGGARGHHPHTKHSTYSVHVPLEPIDRLEAAKTVRGTVHGSLRDLKAASRHASTLIACNPLNPRSTHGGIRHLAASPARVAPHLASWEVQG